MNRETADNQPPPDLWELSLGYDEAGEPVKTNLPTLPHLLVVGGHDWQRQQLFARWMAEARAPCPGRAPCHVVPVASPEVMALLFPDSAGERAQPCRDANEAASLLDQIDDELQLRFRDFASLKIRNIRAHRKLCLENPGQVLQRTNPFQLSGDQRCSGYPAGWLPLIVILIPDLGWLAGSEKALRLVGRISQLGWTSGVHFVAAASQAESPPVVRQIYNSGLPTLDFGMPAGGGSVAFFRGPRGEAFFVHPRPPQGAPVPGSVIPSPPPFSLQFRDE